MIRYDFENLAFEFSPDGSFDHGVLEVENVEADENSTFISRVDLAGPRSRKELINEACELYPSAFDEITLRRALIELCSLLKEKKKEEEENEEESEEDEWHPGPEEGTEEYENAMEILRSEDVLERVAIDMERLGHVGEWPNKKLAFMCAVSAKAQLPVQPSTHAQSSAGKNYLWDTALSLVPPELVYKRTGFSAKALFRTQMSLKHAVLYIQELAGSEGADFSIRTLQSDGVLRWEATEKAADGTLTNVDYEVEGPCVIVQTTTKNHLHPENETRVIPLYLDESAEQTEKITRAVLRRATGDGVLSREEREVITSVWHDAVRLLDPIKVTIPFAERIEVPKAPLRLRRDVPRLLNIIRLVAWLHQHTRDRDDQGRVVANEDDFAKAIAMVGDSFARAWKSLTPSEEKVYAACKTLPERLRKHGFKRSHVEKALKDAGEHVSYTSIKETLTSLAGSGYLESDGRRGPTGATYTLTADKGAAGSITLVSDSARPSGHYEESPANEQKIMAEPRSGHRRPSAIDDQPELFEGEERPMAGNGRNDIRPLDTGDLQEKRANGRMADDGGEGETELGTYRHNVEE